MPSVDAGAIGQPAAPAAAPRIAPRDQRVIWLLLAATFVVILNETIMTVAIPKLMDDLHVDALAAQWLSTAFMLTMAVVIPITGILLQRYTTRQMFIAAMSLFSLGTLSAALAPGFLVLVAARVIQASGTAIMIPLLMTTLMTLVPPAMRGRTMGNVSIVISVAPAIGPTISGLILNFLPWRWIFLIVLPIALVMLLIGMKFVENVTETQKVKIDVLSVILSALGFGGLVYGLTLSGESGGSSASPVMLWGSLIVGVLGLAAFITRQLLLQRKDRALLDLRTFTFPIFTISIVLMAITTASMFGVIIVLPLYLQHVLHLDTLATGLILLPGGLIMGLAAPFVGRLYDRFDPRVLVVPGSILVSLVLWSLTMVTEHTPVGLVIAAHVTMSLGLAMMFTPLFTAGLGAVPPHLYSHGSAILGTIQQVGGAAGTALLIAVLTLQGTALAAGGAGVDAAQAGGIRAAFVAGAIISLFAVAGSFFLRKPADSPSEDVAFAH
ncbi:MFS transporter, DHA2 family, lincomycin resistance protein [Leifsonia sp. 98AMF]|uniref:MDR family MFS transporter n=1 Tax=unclassified Leifsonia TaxID=2663824 RepID=UPI00087B91F2|nr:MULTISPECIES: MDR family MFS transporter [unclassified Leifsonia]SDH46107.1 MFS transporter, DHA2 family, lincomycin resistance protein [Leifsonia sp. 197AMF]SDI91373.1 MFS transporter, DHA2 family, lincomycin resistance protein [Leifsonia sp. 466MF]SDJ88392.1 MFS transporter, DHA2 family, lincomycin resistance protein [Leifsonia sp. 157MF]SDN95048.1 MFS transporter, DHA2 family, lincomycin resistance protein [Leifsonia sp. 509MF]SEN10445.1 MFS transporter, DHA2 family, lincomycin resistanc